jgi:hypothetical protein
MGAECGLHLSFTNCILLSWGSFSRFGERGKAYGKVFFNAERGAWNAEMRAVLLRFLAV